MYTDDEARSDILNIICAFALSHVRPIALVPIILYRELEGIFEIISVTQAKSIRLTREHVYWRDIDTACRGAYEKDPDDPAALANVLIDMCLFICFTDITM